MPQGTLRRAVRNLKISNFLGGARPQTPLFGARDLPRLVLKPGYAPAAWFSSARAAL